MSAKASRNKAVEEVTSHPRDNGPIVESKDNEIAINSVSEPNSTVNTKLLGAVKPQTTATSMEQEAVPAQGFPMCPPLDVPDEVRRAAVQSRSLPTSHCAACHGALG